MPNRGSRGTDGQKGMVFDVQRYSIHDGPGIRTLVFLKGCPLRCYWCCNPESQRDEREIAWFAKNCIGCGRCLEVCPKGAISDSPDGKIIDRSRCDICGKCVDNCYPGALQVIGQEVSPEEVLDMVIRDKTFYKRSKGGVTLSGGEPLLQPDFCLEVLKRCKEWGLHTCMETSGYGDPDALSQLVPYVDLFLYDVKHLDPERHRQYTGVSNEQILDNLRMVDGLGASVIIRVPLIPGYTAQEDNMKALGRLASTLKGVREVHLLPYHRLGEPKYRRVGREYPLEGTAAMKDEEAQPYQDILQSYGLEVGIGG